MANAFPSGASHPSAGNPVRNRVPHSFSLEVIHGKTNHPRRPLPPGRLSIGSGRKCWLQLGGAGVPDIHSWLEVGDKEVELYVFEDEPRVQVDGQPVRFALLRGGESLLIGPYEFLIHAEPKPSSREHFGAPHLSPDQIAGIQAEREQQLTEISAAELVDRLDEEMKFVDQHEYGVRSGWKNLLNAVRNAPEEQQRPAEQNPVATESAESTALAEDFERLVAHVEQLTRSLQERTERLSAREAGYGAAAASLLGTQRKLSEQMELLIAALDKQNAAPLHKAIA